MGLLWRVFIKEVIKMAEERRITFEKPKTVIFNDKAGISSTTYSQVKQVRISKNTFTKFIYLYNSEDTYLGHIRLSTGWGTVVVYGSVLDTYL